MSLIVDARSSKDMYLYSDNFYEVCKNEFGFWKLLFELRLKVRSYQVQTVSWNSNAISFEEAYRIQFYTKNIHQQ